MSFDELRAVPRAPAAANRLSERPTGIVVVGHPEEWERTGHDLPARRGELRFVAFEDIDAEFLHTAAPAMILSPVLARGFDCIDLAARLAQLGYEGAYRAVSKALPSPGMIEREIRQLYPKLDFGVLASI